MFYKSMWHWHEKAKSLCSSNPSLSLLLHSSKHFTYTLAVFAVSADGGILELATLSVSDRNNFQPLTLSLKLPEQQWNQ